MLSNLSPRKNNTNTNKQQLLNSSIRNSSKSKADGGGSPVGSVVSDNVDHQREQKTNKQDTLKNLPPKNILQKRFYSTEQHYLNN